MLASIPKEEAGNLRFSTNATHSPLHAHLQLSWHGRHKRAFFLRAETFYNLATEYADVFRNVRRPRRNP